MQKNYLLSFIAIIILALTYHTSSPASAASPTPSADSNINQVTENIKKRLQTTLDNPTLSPDDQTTLRAYVGTVRDVIKETIVVEDKDGKKNILIGDDATILRSPGNKEIKIEDVRIDDSIIAIGYIKEENELTGRRLIVSTTPLPASNKLTGMGTITKISKSSLTLSTLTESLDLTLSGKTILKSTISAALDLANLSVGDTIIFSAITDEKSKTATIIMRIKTTSSSPTP